MRIATLHSSYEGSDAPFAGLDPECNPARLAPEHEWTPVRLRKATAVTQIIEAARAGFDVFVNLCDGAWDEDRAGIEVVETLERLGVAFTGAGSRFYDPSRTAMKMAAHSVGVPVPAFVVARAQPDVTRAVARLRFPMIVKHPNSYSSVGLTPASRVVDAENLARQVSITVERYGSALIEEFIEGREFTVLVAEPKPGSDTPWVLPPLEFRFPEGETFKHFELKWKTYADMTTHPVQDGDLDRRLREAAALVFDALGGTGYGRCDFRLDESGQLHFLEINPNCGIFYPEGQPGSADAILACEPGGARDFLAHILKTAELRQARTARPWTLEYSHARGFELVATTDLAEGAVAVRYEERSQKLVSRGHVERKWRGRRREWFDRYAWPVSEGVFAVWSDDPEDWCPINHSCDPNTWLQGLDLVTRRTVAPGEPLTVDYATFCGPDTAAFECHCGTAECRRVVRGVDYMRPELRARFAGHLSDYVRTTGGTWTRPLEFVPNAVGLGLITRRAWRKGDKISDLFWKETFGAPSRWTVQRGERQHAEPLPFELRYINHSCAPNVHFDIERSGVFALRDIESDEELRFFYPSTEWDMAEPFDCTCGARECLGKVSGAASLGRTALSGHVLSTYVEAMLGRLRGP